MASKLVFSLDGMKIGESRFCSNDTKSIGRKNGLSVNESKSRAPIRFVTSTSSNELIACRHGIETAGCVTG